MNNRPGRNDPCPCGSGRKHKYCCLAAAARETAATAGFENGSRALASGDPERAVAHFRAALSHAPHAFAIHVELGNALRELGQPQAAVAAYRHALALRPELHALHLNVGVCLEQAGAIDEAVAGYRQAIASAPPDARLHHNLAMALRKQGCLEEAAAQFRRALDIVPGGQASALALAGTLRALGRCEEGLAELERTLAAQGDDADLHSERGGLLLVLGRVEEAIESFARACELDPSAVATHSAHALALLYREPTDAGRVAAVQRRFAERFEARLLASAAPPRNDPDPQRRLRLGYVSGDLRLHSVAYFLEPVLANHDRKRFAIHCYRTEGPVDRVTHRLRTLAEVWVDADGWSDEQLAQRVRDDRIDILVDLSGHTSGNRLLAFARRPAPIQLSWIGYPAHPGLKSIDALLVDAVASPPDGAAAAHAPVLRLPRVFSCYLPLRTAPDPVAAARDAAAAVVFGSFNNSAKISDSVVAVWARILRELPDARLVLKYRSFTESDARRRLLERFAAHAVEADRLTLLGREPDDAGHLALYRDIDIALDTFPYCGVTTSCEALWMGVPVVSLAGGALRSRMGATLLAAVGHPEWVARDEDEYVACALALARDPAARARLRAALRDEMRASPLMDAPGFTLELEALFRERWQAWCLAQAEQASVACG